MKPAPASVVNAISHVPARPSPRPGRPSPPSGPYTGSIIPLKKQPPLTSGGKPLIVYVGSN